MTPFRWLIAAGVLLAVTAGSAPALAILLGCLAGFCCGLAVKGQKPWPS